MHNNQQTRFITLMHDNRVQLSGDIIEDPARALRITVVNDNVQARPQVCKVRVEWANTIANDPNGAFDLNVEPWDGNFQTPDIWVDRDPLGTFENPLDFRGTPDGIRRQAVGEPHQSFHRACARERRHGHEQCEGDVLRRHAAGRR